MRIAYISVPEISRYVDSFAKASYPCLNGLLLRLRTENQAIAFLECSIRFRIDFTSNTLRKYLSTLGTYLVM